MEKGISLCLPPASYQARLESLLGKMKEIVDWVVLLDRPSSIDNCSIPITSTDILINYCQVQVSRDFGTSLLAVV